MPTKKFRSRPLVLVAAIEFGGLCLIGLLPWLRNLFSAEGFVPRWHCGDWHPYHVYADVAADLTIGVAYLGIPIAILWFKRRTREHIPHNAQWVPNAFAVFIFLCGLTHFASPAPFLWPAYRLFTSVKILTALASLPTFLALVSTVRWAAKLVTHAEANREHRERLTEEVGRQAARIAAHNERLQARIEELEAKRDRGSDEMPVMAEIHELRAMMEEIRRS